MKKKKKRKKKRRGGKKKKNERGTLERERRIRECKGTRNRDGRRKQGETSTSERRKKGGPDSFAYDGQWRQPSSEYVPFSISFHLLRIECGYAFSLSRERRESAACFFPRSNRNEFFQEEREQGGKERKKGKKENLTEIRKCSYATPSLPTF